jgi:hypothetical protein
MEVMVLLAAVVVEQLEQVVLAQEVMVVAE